MGPGHTVATIDWILSVHMLNLHTSCAPKGWEILGPIDDERIELTVAFYLAFQSETKVYRSPGAY
jgi:hypothetical protein